ncbi:MAG: polysaccharide biosynthesis/export family protein [Gammaproteobacteria bacterium]
MVKKLRSSGQCLARRLAMQWAAIALVVLVLIAPASGSAEELTQAGGALEPPADYLIGPEDVLEISVWREEGLEREVLVRPDGKLSFPLAGDVQAAGRTPIQIQRDIISKLEKYIPNPIVTVTVKTIGGNKIYVIGQVKTPGSYVVGRYIDVIQALTLAGGLTPFAAENDIKVIRRQGAKEIVFPFEYAEVKKGDHLEQNIFLKGGDVVVVP